MTMLCIPVPWENRKELRRALLSENILMLGYLIRDLDSGEIFEIAEIAPYDDYLFKAFKYAFYFNPFATEKDRQTTMDLLKKHKQTLYIRTNENSISKIHALSRLGAKILKAGGLAIKIESVGKAFSKEFWIEDVKHWKDFIDLYLHFVVWIQEKENPITYYSCGMHQFGLRDAILRLTGEPVEEGLDVANAFLCYLLSENPKITVGETFSLEEHSPRYRIGESLEEKYEPGTEFHNPYGYWTLEAISKIAD